MERIWMIRDECQCLVDPIERLLTPSVQQRHTTKPVVSIPQIQLSLSPDRLESPIRLLERTCKAFLIPEVAQGHCLILEEIPPEHLEIMIVRVTRHLLIQQR